MQKITENNLSTCLSVNSATGNWSLMSLIAWFTTSGFCLVMVKPILSHLFNWFKAKYEYQICSNINVKYERKRKSPRCRSIERKYWYNTCHRQGAQQHRHPSCYYSVFSSSWRSFLEWCNMKQLGTSCLLRREVWLLRLCYKTDRTHNKSGKRTLQIIPEGSQKSYIIFSCMERKQAPR